MASSKVAIAILAATSSVAAGYLLFNYLTDTDKNNVNNALLSNELCRLKSLRNNYYIIRHGESQANIEAIITSNPDTATTQYGLTELGTQQVLDSINSFSNRLGAKQLIIYSSDFLRAQQTANIIHNKLRVKQAVQLTQQLRERNFGDYEGQSNKNYDYVWADDLINPAHTKNNVESVLSVLNRTTKLIKTLDEQYNNAAILLCSHGDTLQILQTAFDCIEPNLHRAIKHLNTAEIRQLKFKPTQYQAASSLEQETQELQKNLILPL
jgi:broad specificity phosphatase PhoE